MTVPDPIEPVDVALIDLRATLEAQFRILTAAQVCIDYHRHHPRSGALIQCAEHLQRLSALTDAGAAGLLDAIAALKTVLDVPAALVMVRDSVPPADES